eukprot:5867303-Amphidinium_carterae.2
MNSSASRTRRALHQRDCSCASGHHQYCMASCPHAYPWNQTKGRGKLQLGQAKLSCWSVLCIV